MKITRLLYNIVVRMAKSNKNPKQETIKVDKPPVNPQSIFGKKPSIFGGFSATQNKGFSGNQITPPQIRITQSKGAGGK